MHTRLGAALDCGCDVDDDVHRRCIGRRAITDGEPSRSEPGTSVAGRLR